MFEDDVDEATAPPAWDGPDETASEALGRMFGCAPEVVARLVRLAKSLPDRYGEMLLDYKDDVDDEVLEATLRALRRVRVREYIKKRRGVAVRPRVLVGDAPVRLCNGCPAVMECVAHNLSTPGRCVVEGVPRSAHRHADGGLVHVPCAVIPVRLAGNRVTVLCDHPRGTFEVALEEIVP